MSKYPVSNTGNPPAASVPFDSKENEISYDSSTSDVAKDIKSRLGLDADQIDFHLEEEVIQKYVAEEESTLFQEWGQENSDHSSKSTRMSTDYSFETNAEMMGRLKVGNVEDIIKFFNQDDQQKEMATHPRLQRIFDELTASEPVNYFRKANAALKVSDPMLRYDSEFEKQWSAALKSYSLGASRDYLKAAKEVATKEIEESVENNSRAIGYINKARCELELGLFEEAVTDCSSAISNMTPVSRTPYIFRGFAYLSLGQNKEALSDVSEAIKISEEIEHINQFEAGSRSQFLYHSRGIIYTKMGLYKEALEDFSQEIEHNPNQGSFRRRALIYKFLGQEEKYKADLAQADNIALLAENAASENILQAMKDTFYPMFAAVGILFGAAALVKWLNREGENRGENRIENRGGFLDRRADFKNTKDLDFQIQMTAEGLSKTNAEMLNEEEKNTLLLIPTFEQASSLFTELLLKKNSAEVALTLNRRLDEMFGENNEVKERLKKVINEELCVPEFCDKKKIDNDNGSPRNYPYETCLVNPSIRHNPLDENMLRYIIRKYEINGIRVMDAFLQEAYEEKAKLNVDVEPRQEDIETEVEGALTPLANEPSDQQASGKVSEVRTAVKLDKTQLLNRERK